MSAILGVTMYLIVSEVQRSVPKHIKELNHRTPISLLAVTNGVTMDDYN